MFVYDFSSEHWYGRINQYDSKRSQVYDDGADQDEGREDKAISG